MPPPVYYLAGFFVGWVINRLIGGPVVPPDAAPSARLVPAGLMVLAGVVVGGSAVWTIKRAGSNVAPMRPTTALVTTGPFRWTRNPIYLGMALCTAGVAVGLNLLWPLLVLPFVIWAIRRRVIAREEQYLDRVFGREYRRYRERVPRWL
ncbi:MAG TPA: methyltransferase [Gemmatimonadaceae bacterium]|jgi:protein-S-isoprenylcysteine O-methyltransferase Ste14|nr:methyltransferase [Gemmatimonadaceae bacterium]